MTVRIFVYTTAKPPKKHITGFAYVLEARPHGEPVTLTNQGTLEDHTKNDAELAAVLKALQHLRKPSELEIYTTPFMATAINKWLPEWKETGWKTRAGKEVGEGYKRLAEALSAHSYTATDAASEYTQWLARTAAEEETRALMPKTAPKKEKAEEEKSQ